MSDDSQEVSTYLHLFVSRAFSLTQVFVQGAVSKVCLRLRGEYLSLRGISMKRENIYNNFTPQFKRVTSAASQVTPRGNELLLRVSADGPGAGVIAHPPGAADGFGNSRLEEAGQARIQRK